MRVRVMNCQCPPRRTLCSHKGAAGDAGLLGEVCLNRDPSMSLIKVEEVRNRRRYEIGLKIKEAVESICREVEAEGVLPIITVQTSPVGCYGGPSRRVSAGVTVEFSIPGGGRQLGVPEPEIEALRGALRGQI
jgi:hypothetical protein